MSSRGIKICDDVIELPASGLDIMLDCVESGSALSWAIQYVYAVGDMGDSMTMQRFEDLVNKSPKGLVVSWAELQSMSTKFDQIYDILIVGCKKPTLLCRYEQDQLMYEACDVVLEYFDCSYWSVYSKDSRMIDNLSLRFMNIQLLS